MACHVWFKLPGTRAMTALPTTKYVKSGDVHIAYQVIGDGPLDVVFVAGFVSNVEAIWDSSARSRQ